MAVLVDERAREAAARRRAVGKNGSIEVEVVPMRRAGYTASVHWSEGAGSDSLPPQGEVSVRVAPRIARYAQWHDVVISTERFGRFELLTLEDPLLLFRVREWERSHPGLVRADSSAH